MSEVSIQIDGKVVAASEDMTILGAAERAGIPIPTVCHHEKLKPFGGCRLCTVEAGAAGRPNLGAAWGAPAPSSIRASEKHAETTSVPGREQNNGSIAANDGNRTLLQANAER